MVKKTRNQEIESKKTDYEILLWGLGQFFVVVSEWKQCSFVSWKQSWSRLGKSSASDASVSISFEVKLDIKFKKISSVFNL